MGFLSKLTSAVVKTALTPVAITKDVVNVLSDNEANATKALLEIAAKDLEESADDLADGEVL